MCAPDAPLALDVVFVLDGSGSTGAVTYERLVDLSADFVELVGASASGVRFAGAVIKSTPSIVFDFVSGQSTSVAVAALGGSGYVPNRASAIAGTLDLVRTTLLTPGRGHRGVMNNTVIVMLTDGSTADDDMSFVYRSGPSKVLACGL